MNEELIQRLWEASVGGCECLTKTPEIQYHAPTCKFRLFQESISALEAASLNERSLEAQIADLKALKEQVHRQLNAVLVNAREACEKGLAAIATYGRRDERGLVGLSKQHFDEISAIHARYIAAIDATSTAPLSRAKEWGG